MLTRNFLQLEAEVQRHVAADQVAQGSYETCFIGCLAKQDNEPEFIESEYGIPLAVSRIAELIFEELPPDEAPLFFAAFPDAVERNGKDLSRVVWQFLAAELRLLPPVTPEVQAVINPVIDGIDLLAEGKKWPEEDARAAARAAARDADSAADRAAARVAARVASAAALAVRAAGWAAGGDAAISADWVAGKFAGRVAASNAASAAASAADCAADCAARAAASVAGRAARAADWAAASAAASAAARAADCAAASAAVRRRQRDLLLKLIKEAPITQQENN